MFSVILQNEFYSKNSDVKNHKDISPVLKEYMDLFSADLTKEPFLEEPKLNSKSD